MKEKIVIIKWRAGLHARPASDLVKTANKFKSKITYKKNDMEVDGKSIIGLMMLGATYKSEIRIIALGEDEHEAIETLVKLFEEGVID